MLVAETVFINTEWKQHSLLLKLCHGTGCTAAVNYKNLNWIGFSKMTAIMIIGVNLSKSKRWCGEGNGTPLQYSCLENPMDGGAWWAAVSGVAQSWTRLKWLSSSSSSSIPCLIITASWISTLQHVQIQSEVSNVISLLMNLGLDWLFSA